MTYESGVIPTAFASLPPHHEREVLRLRREGTGGAVGHEGPHAGGIDFWGQSFVCNPAGKLLVTGSPDQDEVLLATCDRRVIREHRQGWPFLRDRRIDTYSGLTARLLDNPHELSVESDGTK